MLHKKFFTVANICTIARIALIPYILSAINAHAWIIATLLFTVAASTDFLDGYCARLFNEQTTMGALLDPVADKLLTLSCFGVLTMQSGGITVPTWLFFLLLVKELALVLGFLLITSVGIKFNQACLVVVPTQLSKWSTALQLLLIAWLLLSHAYSWLFPIELFVLLTTLIAVMSMGAFAQYSLAALRGAFKIL